MSTKKSSLPNDRFIWAETIALWDINACQIPDGLHVSYLGQSVRKTLAKMNYYGDVSFRLYGDTDSDKIGYYDSTFWLCGLPETTILEHILVDLYGTSVCNRGTRLNLLLIVGDVSKDKAIINAFSVLPVRDCVNVLLCQPSEADSALVSSEVRLPYWEDIVNTAFAISEKKKKEEDDFIKILEERRASYVETRAEVSPVLGEF